MEQRNPTQIDLETEAKILSMIKFLASLYHQTMGDDELKIYYRMFADIDRNDVLKALEAFPKTPEAKYFPKPFEIIELCKRYRKKREDKLLEEHRRELQLAYKRD